MDNDKENFVFMEIYTLNDNEDESNSTSEENSEYKFNKYTTVVNFLFHRLNEEYLFSQNQVVEPWDPTEHSLNTTGLDIHI